MLKFKNVHSRLLSRAIFYVSIVLLLVCSLNVLADTQNTISFDSTPDGAVVCKKVLKRETCYGKTPIQLDISFNNINETKKYIIYKVGYEPSIIQVTPNTKEVNFALSKQSLFPNPEHFQNSELKALQAAINSQLNHAIYKRGHGNEQNFHLTGQIEAFKNGDLTGMKFNILFNNYSVLKDIKKASRKSDEVQKHAALMRAFNEHGAFTFFNTIAEAVATLPLDIIEFDLTYSAMQVVLDYVQINQSRLVLCTYCYGDLKTTRSTKNITILKDEEVIVDYIFLANHEQLRSAENKGIYENLHQFEIFTNNNPDKTFKQIAVTAE